VLGRLGAAQFRRAHQRGLAMSGAEAVDHVLGQAKARSAPTALRPFISNRTVESTSPPREIRP